ncbi:hypothetical protein [Polymorphospora lycopeni]|uniref:Uncharacterized protein n=1 Tax=Polymorphospora lycopeni TaxID=3140240 RepID=A0ABV5D233_9ACTN
MTVNPIEGDVLSAPGSHLLTPTDDLEFVLRFIDESFHETDRYREDDLDEAGMAVAAALRQVQVAVLQRQAVRRGPADVNYCGVPDRYAPACGPDLGLPWCRTHATADEPAPTTLADLLDDNHGRAEVTR